MGYDFPACLESELRSDLKSQRASAAAAKVSVARLYPISIARVEWRVAF